MWYIVSQSSPPLQCNIIDESDGWYFLAVEGGGAEVLPREYLVILLTGELKSFSDRQSLERWGEWSSGSLALTRGQSGQHRQVITRQANGQISLIDSLSLSLLHSACFVF